MPRFSGRKTRFAEIMDAKGIRAEEIAYHCRCSVGYVYKLRRGDKRPSLRMAERLAEFLGVSPAIFFESHCPEGTTGGGSAIAKSA